MSAVRHRERGRAGEQCQSPVGSCFVCSLSIPSSRRGDRDRGAAQRRRQRQRRMNVSQMNRNNSKMSSLDIKIRSNKYADAIGMPISINSCSALTLTSSFLSFLSLSGSDVTAAQSVNAITVCAFPPPLDLTRLRLRLVCSWPWLAQVVGGGYEGGGVAH